MSSRRSRWVSRCFDCIRAHGFWWSFWWLDLLFDYRTQTPKGTSTGSMREILQKHLFNQTVKMQPRYMDVCIHFTWGNHRQIQLLGTHWCTAIHMHHFSWPLERWRVTVASKQSGAFYVAFVKYQAKSKIMCVLYANRPLKAYIPHLHSVGKSEAGNGSGFCKCGSVIHLGR